MISLRPATIADLELLRAWDEQPHVIESDPNDDWGWEVELLRNPDWREQFIAEVPGRPVGFVQIIDPAQEDSHYWGDVPGNLRAIDIWLGASTDPGKGYGTQIMHMVLARCFAAQEVSAVLVDPLLDNVRSHRFYQRLGFVPVRVQQLGQALDECLVHELTRDRYQEIYRP